jgi:curved DNA-binding protein CbpA
MATTGTDPQVANYVLYKDPSLRPKNLCFNDRIHKLKFNFKLCKNMSNNTIVNPRSTAVEETHENSVKRITGECEHSTSDWTSCQRCGRPLCSECNNSTTNVPSLKMTLPITCCKRCVSTFKELSDVTASTTAIPPRLLTEAALTGIESLTYFGVGDRKTNVTRASMYALGAVPLAAGMAVTGVLAGLAGGAFSGLMAGGLGGVALGVDGMRQKSKPKAAISNTVSKTASTSAASSSSTGANTTTANSSAPGDAASSEGAAVPSPAAAALMQRAKALLRLSEEEQAADAESELTRIGACKSAYEVLGLTPDATQVDIRAAFKAKSMAYHPDRNHAPKANECSQAINNAHALISDQEKRDKYDAKGAAGVGDDATEGSVQPGQPNIDIKMRKGGTAVVGVAGLVGAITGLGIGAVGGAVAGVFGGLAGSVSLGRSYMTDLIPASESVKSRIDAKRAEVWKAASTSKTPAMLSNASAALEKITDPSTSSSTIKIKVSFSSVLNSSSIPKEGKQIAHSLDVEPFFMPEIAPDVSLIVDDAFIERFARTVSEDDKEFAKRLARACGGVSKAQRLELGLPEPESSSSDSSSTRNSDSSSHHDATGMSGGDDYQSRDERLRAEAVDVTSMRDLFMHAGKEAGKEMEGKKHSDDLMRLMLLGVQYEAFSRYIVPSDAWVKRRLIGIMRVSSEEERGAAAAGVGEPITNPDRGWTAEETAKMNEARAKARAADEIFSSGPAVVIDVSLGGRGGRGKGNSPRWHRLDRIPCSSISATGGIEQRFFPSLPQALMAEASSSSNPPGSSIKLVIRLFLTGGSFEQTDIHESLAVTSELAISTSDLAQLVLKNTT